MKIIIKDKARFAILLVLLAEIALFIAGLLIGWIEPNPQRFALISFVVVVSVATAMSAIGIKRKTPEELPMDNGIRNLTDEETDIYNNWLEAESETIDGISLYEED